MSFFDRFLNSKERAQSAAEAKKRLIQMMKTDSSGGLRLPTKHEDFQRDLLNVIEHHLHLEESMIEFKLDRDLGVLDIKIPLSTPVEV